MTEERPLPSAMEAVGLVGDIEEDGALCGFAEGVAAAVAALHTPAPTRST